MYHDRITIPLAAGLGCVGGPDVQNPVYPILHTVFPNNLAWKHNAICGEFYIDGNIRLICASW